MFNTDSTQRERIHGVERKSIASELRQHRSGDRRRLRPRQKKNRTPVSPDLEMM
jgi:hypothetical protein